MYPLMYIYIYAFTCAMYVYTYAMHLVVQAPTDQRFRLINYVHSNNATELKQSSIVIN